VERIFTTCNSKSGDIGDKIHYKIWIGFYYSIVQTSKMWQFQGLFSDYKGLGLETTFVLKDAD
jgi:hypothetical protein